MLEIFLSLQPLWTSKLFCCLCLSRGVRSIRLKFTESHVICRASTFEQLQSSSCRKPKLCMYDLSSRDVCFYLKVVWESSVQFQRLHFQTHPSLTCWHAGQHCRGTQTPKVLFLDENLWFAVGYLRFISWRQWQCSSNQNNHK